MLSQGVRHSSNKFWSRSQLIRDLQIDRKLLGFRTNARRQWALYFGLDVSGDLGPGKVYPRRAIIRKVTCGERFVSKCIDSVPPANLHMDTLNLLLLRFCWLCFKFAIPDVRFVCVPFSRHGRSITEYLPFATACQIAFETDLQRGSSLGHAYLCRTHGHKARCTQQQWLLSF
jgi:hypothetical protein